MAELQRRSVGRGADGRVRQRRSPVPLQRTGGHALRRRRPGQRLSAGEDFGCKHLGYSGIPERLGINWTQRCSSHCSTIIPSTAPMLRL